MKFGGGKEHYCNFLVVNNQKVYKVLNSTRVMEKLRDYLTNDGWRKDLVRTREDFNRHKDNLGIAALVGMIYIVPAHLVARETGIYDCLAEKTSTAIRAIQKDIERSEGAPSFMLY